jgi:hypothetical protein
MLARALRGRFQPLAPFNGLGHPSDPAATPAKLVTSQAEDFPVFGVSGNFQQEFFEVPSRFQNNSKASDN